MLGTVMSEGCSSRLVPASCALLTVILLLVLHASGWSHKSKSAGWRCTEGCVCPANLDVQNCIARSSTRGVHQGLSRPLASGVYVSSSQAGDRAGYQWASTRESGPRAASAVQMPSEGAVNKSCWWTMLCHCAWPRDQAPRTQEMLPQLAPVLTQILPHTHTVKKRGLESRHHPVAATET